VNRLELACLTIVAAFWIARGVRERRLGRLLLRGLAISAAAAFGEISCIHLYGAYAYTPGRWTLWLDVVPLLVPLIWPVVILSAYDLAKALGLRAKPVWVTTAIVFLDAAFIEPVAVAAGLWRWTSGSLFGVPIVGVLGWAAFAFGATLLLERPWSTRRTLALLFVPVATAHAGILVAWWGGLRWLPDTPLPDVAIIAVALLLGTALSAWPLRAPRVVVLQRLPGALFFFGQLLLISAPTLLWGWAVGFALPYFALLLRARPRR
jgi:hypothetical protein